MSVSDALVAEDSAEPSPELLPVVDPELLKQWLLAFWTYFLKLNLHFRSRSSCGSISAE
jgi:hypothetical protein